MRSIVPPTGNQLISMIKATSLVSVIAMADLLYSVQSIYNRTFEVIPMLMVAVLWYLLITSILNVGQGFIERYYARGEKGSTKRGAPRSSTTQLADADDRSGQCSAPSNELHRWSSRATFTILRRRRGAEGHRSRCRAGRSRRHPRSFRLGKIHFPALHQPPRGHRPGLHQVDGEQIGYQLTRTST